MFPDFLDICQQYKAYFIDAGKTSPVNASTNRFLRAGQISRDLLSLSSAIAKIARLEDVDLIIGPSESPRIVWMSYLSGKICKKPWTSIFTAEAFLFLPTRGLGPLNPLNVLKHVSQKEETKKISLMSKIGFSIELLSFLKIAEKSLILTVSPSISEEIRYLNPKIQFHIITPGNGIDLEKFDKKSSNQVFYDVVFFSRLIPEKGLFDLPEIFKLVVQRFPKAKIAVAGAVEDNQYLERFQKMLSNYNLNKNTVLLLQREEKFFIDLLSSSKVMVFPSTLEAYGLVVLEALACGTPVVAYNIPAMKLNFGDVKAVLRCPIKDNTSMAKSVEALLENEDLRKKLSHEAKEYVKNYDWKNVVKAEKKAYFKVIEYFNSRVFKPRNRSHCNQNV
jgi:glycosyltransferase involved in cell wall biosynthesis